MRSRAARLTARGRPTMLAVGSGAASWLASFHGHPTQRIADSDIVDADNAGMLDGVHRLHGPDEALHLRFVAGNPGPQVLQRQWSVVLGIFRQENGAGFPLGEFLLDLVSMNRPTWRREYFTVSSHGDIDQPPKGMRGRFVVTFQSPFVGNVVGPIVRLDDGSHPGKGLIERMLA